MQWIDRKTVVKALRVATKLCQPGEQPILELSFHDPRLVRADFVKCTDGGYKGLDQGQTSECRFSVDDGPEGLHMHQNVQQGWLRFHLDNVDPLRNDIGHLFSDTNAGAGLMAGGLAAAALAKANPWLALGVLVLGTFVGAQSPRRRFRMFTLQVRAPGVVHVVPSQKDTTPQHAYTHV